MEAPEAQRPEARHLDVDEARRLLECAEGWRLEAAAVLGLVGGMRAAEVCSITWRDVDFHAGEITVRGSYWGATKSGKPRTFAMPSSAMARLRRCRAAQREDLLRRGVRQTDATPVVTKRDGTPMSPSTLWFAFDTFRTKHGFDVSFHGLRHTATVLLLGAGVDVKTAAARLGHSPAVLLRTYAHHMPSTDQWAATKIDALLAGDPAL